MSDMMTVTELAERWSVNRKTVLNYIRKDKLNAIRTPGGNYRIYRASVEQWERENSDGKRSGDTRRDGTEVED